MFKFSIISVRISLFKVIFLKRSKFPVTDHENYSPEFVKFKDPERPIEADNL